MSAGTIEPTVTPQDTAYDEKKHPISDKDIETGSGDVNYSTFVVDKTIERKLLWKFDLHILPLLAIMYLFKSVTPLFYITAN